MPLVVPSFEVVAALLFPAKLQYGEVFCATSMVELIAVLKVSMTANRVNRLVFMMSQLNV